jgi:hypothetical protein
VVLETEFSDKHGDLAEVATVMWMRYLGAAAGAQKHRPRVASMIAAHLIGLRLVGTVMGSDSATILIAGVCEWASAGGGEALLGATSREPWVTLLTIAWPPSLTETCCTVSFGRRRFGSA